MVATSLLSNLLLTLAIAIAAKPVLEQKSPLKELRTGSFTNHNTMGRDWGREISNMRRAGDQDELPSVMVEANLTAGLIYSVIIYLGDPPLPYNLIGDTGSSNTWVTEYAYKVTKSSQATNEAVSRTYGSGSFSGVEWNDIITIGIVAFNQSIGVASQSEGVVSLNLGFEGILGIGPNNLSVGSFSSNKGQSIPTPNDSFFGTFGFSYLILALQPFGTIGQIIWGGIESIDPTLFVGDIIFGPMSKTDPDNGAWCIDFSLSYGNLSLLTNAVGILDIGTSFIYLNSDAYYAYKVAIGAVFDTNANLLSMPLSQFNTSTFLDLNILYGNPESFPLNGDAQILPLALNTYYGGVSQQVYFIIVDGGSEGTYVNIIGAPFWTRFLVVIGISTSTNQQVGFALTKNTFAISNSIEVPA